MIEIPCFFCLEVETSPTNSITSPAGLNQEQLLLNLITFPCGLHGKGVIATHPALPAEVQAWAWFSVVLMPSLIIILSLFTQ